MDESTNNQEEKYLTMTANVLGYLGSLPFIALAATISIANVDAVVIAKSALYLYGAIILSFLGGLHWGRIASKKTIVSSDKWVLLYSVVPSLIGWFSFLLKFFWSNTAWILIIGFVGSYFMDRFFIKDGTFKSFMGSLRLNLTIIACISLSFLLV